jgi:hypothetical protein
MGEGGTSNRTRVRGSLLPHGGSVMLGNDTYLRSNSHDFRPPSSMGGVWGV